MTKHKTMILPISSLLLNLKNPRLHHGASNISEAIKSIIDHVGHEKMANLAIDIAQSGLSPKPFYVVKDTDQSVSDKYVVLDGNRRLTAIKIIENPSYLDSASKKRVEAALSEDSFIGEVLCTIFASEEEADPWIRREHLGEQGGVGTVPWGTEEKDAYEGKNTLYMQVYDFMKRHGKVTDEEWSKITKTTLEDRILGSKVMRSFLGLDSVDGKLVAILNHDEIVKGLSAIFKDLISGKASSRTLNNHESQLKYLSQFNKSETPDSNNKSDKPWNLVDSSPANEPPPEKKQIVKPDPYRIDRARMIPPGWKFVANPLANEIVKELQQIPLRSYKNCAAISVRSLLEIATNCYIETKNISAADNFKIKFDTVIKHMKTQGLSRGDCSYLDSIGAKTDKITKELHAHTHGKLIATERDLKEDWNNLHRYFEIISELIS